MKILYCVVGMGFYGIIEDDILQRDKLFISTRRVFSIEVDPNQSIRSPRGEPLGFIISTYENVMMDCVFIADMSEKAVFYQKIMEILKGEKANEN